MQQTFCGFICTTCTAGTVKAPDTDLFTGLIRSKGDAEDGSNDPAKPDDLIHAAAHDVNRDGKANTTVGSTGGVDSCVDTCSS